MSNYIISYASIGYYSLQDRLMNSIKLTNIHKYHYTDKWLKSKKIYSENIQIFNQKKGAGYWLWKPFIIKDRLEKMNFGDILFYSDVDAFIIDDLTPLFELCKNKDILLFKNSNQINKDWTKRDCYILMNADDELYYESPQIVAGLIFIKKTIENMKLIDEWVKFACDARILTDKKNELGKENLITFKEHRHDQSILGILAKKHEIELFRDPSEFGNPYKIKNLRVDGEYLENGHYIEERVLLNSEYNQILTFNNDSVQKNSFFNRIKRQFNHFKPFIK